MGSVLAQPWGLYSSDAESTDPDPFGLDADTEYESDTSSDWSSTMASGSPSGHVAAATATAPARLPIMALSDDVQESILAFLPLELLVSQVSCTCSALRERARAVKIRWMVLGENTVLVHPKQTNSAGQPVMASLSSDGMAAGDEDDPSWMGRPLYGAKYDACRRAVGVPRSMFHIKFWSEPEHSSLVCCSRGIAVFHGCGPLLRQVVPWSSGAHIPLGCRYGYSEDDGRQVFNIRTYDPEDGRVWKVQYDII